MDMLIQIYGAAVSNELRHSYSMYTVLYLIKQSHTVSPRSHLPVAVCVRVYTKRKGWGLRLVSRVLLCDREITIKTGHL